MLRASAPSAPLAVSEELVSLPPPPSTLSVSNLADRDVFPTSPSSNISRSSTKKKPFSAPAVFLAALAVVFLLLRCSSLFTTKRKLAFHQRRLASDREGNQQSSSSSSDSHVCGGTPQGWMFEEEEDESEQLFAGAARANVYHAISVLEKEALATEGQGEKRKVYGDQAEWLHSSQKAARLPGDRSVSDPQTRFQSSSVGAQSSHHLGSLAAAQQQPPARTHAGYSTSRFPRPRPPVPTVPHHLARLPLQQQTLSSDPRASYPRFQSPAASSTRATIGVPSHTPSTSAPVNLGESSSSGSTTEASQEESPVVTTSEESTSPAGDDESIALESTFPLLPEDTLDLYVAEALQQDDDALLESWLLDPDSLPPASPASVASKEQEEEDHAKEAEALNDILFELLQEAEDFENQQETQTEPSPQETTSQPSPVAKQSFPPPHALEMPQAPQQQQFYIRGPSEAVSLPQQSREVLPPSAGGQPRPSLGAPIPKPPNARRSQAIQPASGALTAADRLQSLTLVATFYEKHPFYRLPGRPESLNLPALRYKPSQASESTGNLPQLLNILQAFLAKPSLNEEEALSLQKHARELIRYARYCMTDSIGGTMASKFVVPMAKRFLVADILWSVCAVLGPSMEKDIWWRELMDKMLADPLSWPPADRRRTARGELVNYVLAAFHLYKEGDRPPPLAVVEIKRAIFSGNKAPFVFRQKPWDLWRNLEDSYAAAVVSDGNN
ncbi:hypothetical protein Emed_004274 [Eimeria media]